MLAITLLLYVVVTALAILLSLVVGPFALLITVAGVFWLQGVLVKLVEDVRDGTVDLSLREMFEAVAPRVNHVTAVGFLAGAGVALGLAFLVVPGLVLMTWWSMVIPATVLERTGIARSFSRSVELVRGEALNVFVVLLLTFGVLVALQIGIDLAVESFTEPWIGALTASVVSNLLLAPFVAIATGILYFALRERASAGSGPAR